MKAREKKKLEKILIGSEFRTNPEKDRHVLEKAIDRLSRNEQEFNPVSIWRFIMKSPATRVAGIMLLMASIAIMSWQSPSSHSKNSSLTLLSLINTACAAEKDLFTGEGIIYIIHEITLYPNTAEPDLPKKLDELIESNFTLNKNLDFVRAWFSSHSSLPVHSLRPDGSYRWDTLELTGTGDQKSIVQEHIWYDPHSGFFVRAFMQSEQLIFAVSYDGKAVYTTQVLDNNEFHVLREEITPTFKLPGNPAEILGISASFQGSMDKMNLPPIEEESRRQIADGKWLKVYKLSWPGTDAYHLFKVDENDKTIEQIESVAYENPVQQIERLSRETVKTPVFSWNLAELEGANTPAQAEVVVTEGVIPVTPQLMAELAQVDTYVLGSRPDWIKEQKFVIMSDKASPYGAKYVVICTTNDGRCIAIPQGQTIHHFISGILNMSNQAGLRWLPNYMSHNRFKVHDVATLGRVVGIAILSAFPGITNDTGTKLWSSDALFKQLGFEPLPYYQIYMLHSPTDAYFNITFNGKFTDAEVQQLVESLIPAQLYDSDNEAKDWYAKIDPGSVVYKGFEPGKFLKDWMILGPVPVFGDDISDADKFNDGASQMAAFDRNMIDINTFEPTVNIDGKQYYWEKYSSGAEIIEFAWLYGYHGFADAYARTQIEMEEDTPVLLAVRGDDRFKVWLNGQLVYELRSGGTVDVDKALVPVTLRKGLNDLVLKVQNGIFEWEYAVRIFEADYDPAADIKKPVLDSVTYRGLVQGEFMKEWLLLGPIPAAEGVPSAEVATAAFQRDYLPSLDTFSPVVQIDGKEYNWAFHRSYRGIIDLGRFWDKEPSKEHASCYAWSQIDMPVETEALLGFGTDDAARVWLNGKLILDSWTDRGAFPDHDRVRVTFKEGSNQLVIKVYNNLRNWKFCCRLLE